MALTNFPIQPAIQKIASWMTNTLSSVGDGLLATNCSGQVLFMNSRAEQLTGWSLESALNQFASEVFRLLDEDLAIPTFNPLCEAFIEEEIVRPESACFLLSADGQHIRIDYTAAPIRDESGKVVGAVIVFREVQESSSSPHPALMAAATRIRSLH